MPDAEGTPTWEELYERAGRRIDELHAEVERLRGIVQADLEEKAEAWGEVERLRVALEVIRGVALPGGLYSNRALFNVATEALDYTAPSPPDVQTGLGEGNDR